MDIYDNTNVLDEVESLFNKLESVPETTKHDDFSRIHEKVSAENKLKLCMAPGNISTSSKVHNFNTSVEKKKENCPSNTGKIRDKGRMSFIDDDTCRSTNTRRIDWEDDNGIDDTLESLHEMLFSDETGKLLEDVYPWNDHAYENKTNLISFAQSIEEENRWLFEGFPINSCPSIFHTYSNMSATLIESKTNVSSEAREKIFSPLPIDPRKKPFVCVECHRAFPDVYYLNLHKKRHKGEKDFLCDQCPYMNCNKDELQRHIKRVHLKIKEILCEYCGKFFSAVANLKEHLKLVHLKEESFVCQQCNYSTFSQLNLNKHVVRVHQYQRCLSLCSVCGLKVKGKLNLINHIKSHTKHKSYSCNICGKSFSLEKRLIIHKKTVHQPRQFSCDICNKLFQSKFHLDRHVAIHFNSKPFSCPYCTYASNTHGNLSKHVRSIHQKKDFSIKKFKNPQSIDEVNLEVIERGKAITTKFLSDLSKQLGEDITIKSLQEQKLLEDMAREVELLKSKNISKKYQAVDHSYSEKFNSIAGPIKIMQFNVNPLVPNDTELNLSMRNENDIQMTVSKIGLEKSLQAHYQRVQDALYCDKPDAASNKTDHMLCGGHILPKV